MKNVRLYTRENTMRDRRNLLFVIFFLASFLSNPDCAYPKTPGGPERGYGDAEIDVPRNETLAMELLDPMRNVWLPTDVVIDTLSIKPGMEILDLGAGVGIFTFLMADKLKGTGRVYATEIYPFFVDYMNQKAQRKSYKNVTAALVTRHTFDQFYKDKVFDIILCCESLGGFLDIRRSFSELRNFLSKKTGRLYIIAGKRVSNYIKENFEMNLLSQTLDSKPPDFPIIKRLDPAVLEFIHAHKGGPVPSAMQDKIINNLNSMLLDRELTHDFADYYFKNNKISTHFTDWMMPLVVSSSNEQYDYGRTEFYKVLIGSLDEGGVFDNTERPLTDLEAEQLHMLNKRLISEALIVAMTRFRFIQGYDNPIVLYLGKKSIISKIEAAGYKLVKDHDNLSQCYFLEFKRND